MARTKAVEPAAKTAEVAEAEAIEIRTEDIQAEETVAESKAATEKEEKPKKTPGRKKTVKAEKAETEAASPVKEKVTKTEAAAPANEKAVETAKKGAGTAAGKTAAKKTEKAEPKALMHIQYGGKSISQENLVKSAKDIWKYDLKRKAGDLTSIELYVKPEENRVYYVMNGDVTGCFDI